MKRLKLAGIGCGNRVNTYMRLAAKMGERYEIVGAADPIAWKTERIAQLSDAADFKHFSSATQLLAAEKFADVLVIGTQDSHHVEQCIAAMEKGYDVVLEKPIATNLADCLKLELVARQLKRRVLICHVLRYTPFYQKVKQIVASGQLGEIMTLQASEGVGTFHQAHSFVRGHWSVAETSSPMLIQKSCHDLDIIQWIMDRPFKQVSSFGGLNYFVKRNMPEGAPHRCIEGCPVGETCQYNAMRYLTDQRRWMPYVYNGGENITDPQVRAWLKTSPWGRCAYDCDNTAVDHQVLNIEFTGGATATFTMSAFDEGRNLEIWGTKAVLRGGDYTKRMADADIIIREHATGQTTRIDVDGANGELGHGGGDWGLIDSLYDEMHMPDASKMRSSLTVSVQSHLMGFAAEASRTQGRLIDAETFRSQHMPR